MNVQVTHVIVHTPEQTRDIIAEAKRIADETHTMHLSWSQAFREACKLLGQRYTLALTPEPAPIALPHMAIPGGRR